MTHNFDHLDRGEMVPRNSINETLTPDQRAAGKKAYEELILTSGFPEKAGWLGDGLPRLDQGRADLLQLQEQGARQGVHQVPARRG